MNNECLYVIVLNGMAISVFDKFNNSKMIILPYDEAHQVVDKLRTQNGQDYKIVPEQEYFKNILGNDIKPEGCESDLSNLKKEIKYEDYVFMCVNESEKEKIYNPYIKATSVTFIEYFEYLINTKFSDVEKTLFEGLDIKKLQNRTDDELIEGILILTDKEKEKRMKDRNYYMCNAICSYKMLKSIFTIELLNMLKHENVQPIALHNYCHILKYFLMDIEQLINEYQNNVKNNFKYRANSSRIIHTMSLHNILRQSLYGQVSIHSFSDVEIDASISVIRQMIELRIRRAFGVIAVMDGLGKIKPLDMTKIFEVLNKYGGNIQFPVKLSSIERIYRWANLYIHSGRGGYSWLPYFIEVFLRDFSFGVAKEDKSWSYKNAIKTSRETLAIIQEELLKTKSDNKEQDEKKQEELILLSCIPEIEFI